MEVLKQAEAMGLRWGRADGVPVSRQQVVEEARSWIGTPYRHQGEMKHVGVDCGGLIRGVSVALGLIPATYRERVPSVLLGYAKRPDGYLGRDLCDFYWNRIDVASVDAGDLVLFSYGTAGVPHHIGILATHPCGCLSVVHALGPRTIKKVVEHRFDDKWRGRVIAAYSLPGVA